MFFWLNFFSSPSLSTLTTLVPLTDRRPGTCSITTFLCERREEWVSLSCWAWLLSCWPLSLLPTLNLGSVFSPMTMLCPLHRCCRWGQQLCGDLVHQPTVCKSLTRDYIRLQDDGLYETSLVSSINHLLPSQLLALLKSANTFFSGIIKLIYKCPVFHGFGGPRYSKCSWLMGHGPAASAWEKSRMSGLSPKSIGSEPTF